MKIPLLLFLCSLIVTFTSYGAEGIKSENSLRLSREACDRGNIMICLGLAKSYVEGRGVEKNPLKAMELYIEVCNSGKMRYCGLVASIYEKGMSIDDDDDEWSEKELKPNLSKAKKYYKKACSGNLIESCHTLGLFHSMEFKDEYDGDEAIKYFELACSKGHKGSCSFMGGAYLYGSLGIQQDVSKGLEFYTRSCDLGYKFSCDLVREHESTRE